MRHERRGDAHVRGPTPVTRADETTLMTPNSRAIDSSGDAPRTDQRAAGLFIRYLMELPLLDWIEAARRRGVDARRRDAETTLRVRLRQLDHHGDVFATKDGVLAALQRFECNEGR